MALPSCARALALQTACAVEIAAKPVWTTLADQLAILMPLPDVNLLMLLLFLKILPVQKIATIF